MKSSAPSSFTITTVMNPWSPPRSVVVTIAITLPSGDTAHCGCFQKENAYSLGALEIIALVAQSEENYYRLLQGCFPLSAIRFIAGNTPVWQSVKNFNKENQTYFKKKMDRILYYFSPQGVSQTVSPPR